MMTLSFIVPMYKVECFVKECIESILAIPLAPSDYEIIAVDDGSPDQSADIIQSLMPSHPQIHLIRQTNQGLSAARNNGLKVAQGEYVWFVDSDDRIISHLVPNLVQTLQQIQPDMMRIGAIFESQPGRGNTYTRGWMSAATAIAEPAREVCVPLYLYRRAFLVGNALSFLSGIYHEDNEFQPRAVFLAKRVLGYQGEPVYWVRDNASSITHTFSYKRVKDIFHTAARQFHHLCFGYWKDADWAWKKAVLKNIRWANHSIIRYICKR
ncbi:MAG: glycosyltransferase [Paludibacteraceae bacterium]|nr:glycosyltransferase [Paludibacteraceae bacterium]